jgi:uncharacterized protein YceK
MRRATTLAVLAGAAVAALGGCGTFANVCWLPEEEGGKRVYGGVRGDWESAAQAVQERTADESLAVVAKVAVDLPLSAAADTLTLPITLGAAAKSAVASSNRLPPGSLKQTEPAPAEPGQAAAVDADVGIQGTWEVLAQAVRSGESEGLTTFEPGNQPTVVIAPHQLTITVGKTQTVYALQRAGKPGEFFLDQTAGFLGEPIDVTPPPASADHWPLLNEFSHVSVSLDGDLLKICRAAKAGRPKVSEAAPGPIPGLPAYQVVAVHPYWQNVLFVAKRTKP